MSRIFDVSDNSHVFQILIFFSIYLHTKSREQHKWQSEGNTRMSWKLLFWNNFGDILVNNNYNVVYLPTPDACIKVLESSIIFKGTCSHRVGFSC